MAKWELVCVNLKVLFGEIIQLYYDKSTEWEIFTSWYISYCCVWFCIGTSSMRRNCSFATKMRVQRYLWKWRVSSDNTGKCMVDGNSSSVCISISSKSTGNMCGDNLSFIHQKQWGPSSHPGIGAGLCGYKDGWSGQFIPGRFSGSVDREWWLLLGICLCCFSLPVCTVQLLLSC